MMPFTTTILFKVVKVIVLIAAFFLVFSCFLPITNQLLSSSPSVLGWAEIIVFITHTLLGFFCFVSYFILEKIFKITVVLMIGIIYLLSLDFIIYSYGKVWMLFGLIVLKIVELYFIHKLYKKNYLGNRSKKTVSLIIAFLTFLLYFVLIKF